MENKFKGVRIEFHIIQSFPVSCLNRDDMGSPKSAVIGGIPRARVSSQCWKRAVRMAMHELGVPIAKRTKYIVDAISQKCTELGATPEQAENCSTCIADTLGKLDDEKDKNKNQQEDKPKCKSLVFISEDEIARIASALKEENFQAPKQNPDEENGKKSKNDARKNFAKKILGNNIKVITKCFQYRDGLDIALFGRMVADAQYMNVEAAASFAHAISTHRVNPELDYFTAVEEHPRDPENEKGSAHVDSLEFNSATYYRYISLDLGQLEQTLKSEDIVPAVEAFTKALFLAVPAARQATMSAANPWNYALVTLRKGQRMQLGFQDAVRTSAAEPDLTLNSINSLKKKFADAERMYGSLFGLIKKSEISQEKGSIDELLENLKTAVAGL